MDFETIAGLAQLAIKTADMKLPTNEIAKYIESAVGLAQERRNHEAVLCGRILLMRKNEDGEFKQFRVVLEEVKPNH